MLLKTNCKVELKIGINFSLKTDQAQTENIQHERAKDIVKIQEVNNRKQKDVKNAQVRQFLGT
jgi:hypothetical protein